MIGNNIKKIIVLFVCLFAWTVFAATDVKNDATLSTNLVSYWEMEEESGSRTDSHGSNDLTDNNTVLYSASGKINNAADFEQDNSEYFSLSGTADLYLDGTTDLSFSYWIKTETLNGYMGTMGRWFVNNKNYLQRLNGTTGVLEFFVGDGNTTRGGVSGTTNIGDGAWHHVVTTWDSSDDKARIYIDGNTTAEGTSAAYTTSKGTSEFRIGRDQAGSSSYFDGLIDEVVAWDKVLSSGEITDLYNSGSGIPYEAGAPPSGIDYRYIIQ